MSAAQTDPILRYVRKLVASGALQERTDQQLLDDFAARRKEAAFAALVARHGPMVLRVCRRVLGHEQDAEDAFQATFLVLARHNKSIRKRDALADWLHGVAYRTAMKAKRSAARRRTHEERARPAPSPPASPTWNEVQAALDEELRRLSEPFRQAFVLCVLEGKSEPQAAAFLGCKQGTVSSRVARARQQLQRQLTRRGINLGTLLAALAVGEGASQAVAGALVHSTVRYGLLAAAGATAASQIPAHVSALAQGVSGAMFTTKLNVVTATVLAVGLFAGAAALGQRVPAAGEAAKPTAASSPKPQAARATPQAGKPPAVDDNDSVAFSGRVLGPDGQPVAGAKLYVSDGGGYLQQASPSPVYGTTESDGRFRFTVPKAQFQDYFVVTATAANRGPGWVIVPGGRKRDDLTLRLVDDNVPITGQIVDLEGKPVASATLTVFQINAGRGEDLGAWLEAVKGKKGDYYALLHRYLAQYTIALCPQATTDAAGRLRLTGIGRNRVVWAQLDGPTIASQRFQIRTQAGKTLEITEHEGRPEDGEPRTVATFYGASFRHVVAPTRPVVGVVRDKDTKKPLAGFTIRSHAQEINPSAFRSLDIVRTTTDSAGHYRLTGMTKAEGIWISAIPPDDQPYVAVKAKVPDRPGLDPVTVDFELKQGIWIEGKLTDKVTGKPCKGAVEYLAIWGNPNLPEYPGFDGGMHMRTFGVKEDGSYRAVGLPGPGLIGVYYHRNPYLRADEREDEYGTKEKSLLASPYHISFTSNYNALARINPARGVTAVKRNVTLDPGWTFKVIVLGPDSKSITGARTLDLNQGHWWQPERMKTAEFTAGFNPGHPRELLFQHPEKGLVGVGHPPKANGGAVSVRLEPGAAVTGRLVDGDGKARAGVELWALFHPKGWGSWFDYTSECITTDWEGRFRIAALLPGYEFRLSDDQGVLHFGAGLRSGETKDSAMCGLWRTSSNADFGERGVSTPCCCCTRALTRPARQHERLMMALTLDPWVPYVPDKRCPWDLRRVGHLDRRVGFAATWDELQRNLKAGPQASINRLLAANAGAQGVPAEFASTANLLAESAVSSNDPNRLKAWWVYRMLFGPDPLTERLVLMWHNHFATSNLKVQNLAALHTQNQLFRDLARAPFGRLLGRAVRDPALLVWLDAPANRRGHPNENLARELMELFTLGIGNYTENDVREAARALTGWGVSEDGRFEEQPARHDDGEKMLFGRRGRWTGADLVRMLLEHPATARRLAFRVCELFMGEGAVDAAMIQSLADGLRQRDLDIGWAVATVLRSRAFFAERNLGRRVLGPVEYVIGAARALELLEPPPSTLLLAEWVARLGQDLFYPPNVGGWPGGRAWLTTRAVIGRANYVLALVDGGGVGRRAPLDALALARRHGHGESLDTILTFYTKLLLGVEPTAAWRAWLMQAVGPGLERGQAARRLVTLVLATPEAQLA